MPSFDVVSEVDLHELQNAVDQTVREIGTRYDFKGTSASVEQKDTSITLKGESDFQIQQIVDVLYQKLAKRGVDIESLERGKIETSGMLKKQELTVRQGIETETAKKIVKSIKDRKLKVQAAIQGDQVRVTGKKRDDLQEVMSFLRGAKLGVPLQYTNFRD